MALHVMVYIMLGLSFIVLILTLLNIKFIGFVTAGILLLAAIIAFLFLCVGLNWYEDTQDINSYEIGRTVLYRTH